MQLLIGPTGLDSIGSKDTGFKTAELSINSGSSTTDMFYKWASATPDDFIFTLRVVSGKDLSLLPSLLRRASVLGDKLGPVVITIPAGEPYRHGSVSNLMSSLPGYRYALDIKSTAWHCRAAYEEMEALDVPVLRRSINQDGPETSWRIFKLNADDAISNLGSLSNGPSTVVIARSEPTKHQRLWQILKDLNLDEPLTGVQPGYFGPHEFAGGMGNNANPAPDDSRREYPKVKKPYNAVEDAEDEAEKHLSGTDEPMHMTYPKTFDSDGLGNTDDKMDLGYGPESSKKKKIY